MGAQILFGDSCGQPIACQLQRVPTRFHIQSRWDNQLFDGARLEDRHLPVAIPELQWKSGHLVAANHIASAQCPFGSSCVAMQEKSKSFFALPTPPLLNRNSLREFLFLSVWPERESQAKESHSTDHCLLLAGVQVGDRLIELLARNHTQRET